MSGKNPRLSPLALRKQLLIAESELNRAQLVQEWNTVAGEVQALADQAKTIKSMAAAAGLLLTGLVSGWRNATGPPGKKLPWWQTLLKGAGVVSSFWTEFRARPQS